MTAFLVALTLISGSPTDDLSWRSIGPFRGGRTVGACGTDAGNGRWAVVVEVKVA